MGSIHSFKITDVAIVVVRYFGGTKLGTSGLKTAYKEAAHSALNMAAIIKKIITVPYRITLSYSHLGVIMDALKAEKINIVASHLDANPRIDIALPKSKSILKIRQLKSLLLNRPIEDIDEETILPYCKFKML